MAALTPAQAGCVIEKDLAMLTGRNNPALREKEQLGFSIAVTSPQNTDGFEQLDVQQNKSIPLDTSKRKVLVKSRAKKCSTVTDASGPLSCGTGINEGDTYEYVEVNVDKYVTSKKVSLSRLAYADLCNGLAQEQSIRIAELAADILRQRNRDFITKFITYLTDYSDGTSSVIGGGTEKTISLFDAEGRTQPMGLMPLFNNYANLGYMDRPIMVGGNQINSWQYAADVFRGNLDGLDPNRVALGGVFYDNVQDILAADGNQHLFTWIPGHIQALSYLYYAPNTGLARQTEEIVKGTINIGGTEFDILIDNQACNNEVRIQLGLGYGLWTPFESAFAADCGGQRTILNWILDCGALNCETVK